MENSETASYISGLSFYEPLLQAAYYDLSPWQQAEKGPPVAIKILEKTQAPGDESCEFKSTLTSTKKPKPFMRLDPITGEDQRNMFLKKIYQDASLESSKRHVSPIVISRHVNDEKKVALNVNKRSRMVFESTKSKVNQNLDTGTDIIRSTSHNIKRGINESREDNVRSVTPKPLKLYISSKETQSQSQNPSQNHQQKQIHNHRHQHRHTQETENSLISHENRYHSIYESSPLPSIYTKFMIRAVERRSNDNFNDIGLTVSKIDSTSVVQKSRVKTQVRKEKYNFFLAVKKNKHGS